MTYRRLPKYAAFALLLALLPVGLGACSDDEPAQTGTLCEADELYDQLNDTCVRRDPAADQDAGVDANDADDEQVDADTSDPMKTPKRARRTPQKTQKKTSSIWRCATRITTGPWPSSAAGWTATIMTRLARRFIPKSAIISTITAAARSTAGWSARFTPIPATHSIRSTPLRRL